VILALSWRIGRIRGMSRSILGRKPQELRGPPEKRGYSATQYWYQVLVLN